MRPSHRAALAMSALSCMLVTTAAVRAQDLPPELSGDFSNVPPPAPAPAPTPSRPARKPAPPAPVPNDEPPLDPELGDVGPAPGEEPAAETTEPAEPPPEDTEVEATEEPAAVDEAPSAPSHSRWSVRLGAGAGTLSFTRPMPSGTQHLPTTPYAAVDMEVRGWLHADRAFSLGLLAQYQTSIAWSLEEQPLFGLPEQVPTRTQALELSFAPTFRLGEGVHLALPVGASLRWFVPKVHQYPVDPYTLGALLVRAEVIYAFNDMVSLRVGPEASWILFVNQALEREQACCTGGAIGGQASVQARLGKTFSLSLTVRESRALIPSAARFSAVERIGTAGLVGDL